MAPSPTPVGNPVPPAQSQTPQPVPTAPRHRPLQREGAVIFLSQAEQALRDAMLRSSLTPEPVLGKRTHREQDTPDGSDTEPDEEGSSTTHPQSLLPSISNITAASLRYATKKKLRPEQCNDLEAFLLVSASSHFMTIVVGQAFNAFAQFPLSSPSQAEKDVLLHQVGLSCLELIALAIGSVALGSLTSCLRIWVGEINAMSLSRKVVYESVVGKDV
jgi:hypothetical protein